MYRVLTIGKNLLNGNISSTCPHNMVTSAHERLASLGHPSKFQRVFASLLHRHRSTDVNQTLHDVWPSPWLVHYIYFLWAVAP